MISSQKSELNTESPDDDILELELYFGGKMEGIKETKEALIGVNELALFLVKRLKDGADLNDALAIWEKLQKDDEFKEILQKAWDGYQAVPNETKDLNVPEAIELISVQLEYLPKFVDELST